MEIRVEIPLRPVPKARPRVGAKTSMPTRYKSSRDQVSWLMLDAKNRLPFRWPTDSSYAITYTVWQLHQKDGDVDNLVGTVMDAGNDILWDDDRQVAELHVFRYLGSPKALLKVQTLP